MEEAPKEENSVETIKGETIREGQLLKDRIDAMLSRIDSVKEKELALIAKTIHDANQKFDELGESDEWMEALKESHK